jgi:hypothetical protein
MWYVYTMVYYSAIKNKIVLYAGKWSDYFEYKMRKRTVLLLQKVQMIKCKSIVKIQNLNIKVKLRILQDEYS